MKKALKILGIFTIITVVSGFIFYLLGKMYSIYDNPLTEDWDLEDNDFDDWGYDE